MTENANGSWRKPTNILRQLMRVVRHIREAKIAHHTLIYIETKYYHMIKPDKMICHSKLVEKSLDGRLFLFCSHGFSGRIIHVRSSRFLYHRFRKCQLQNQLLFGSKASKLYSYGSCNILQYHFNLNSTVGDQRPSPTFLVANITAPSVLFA